MTSQPTHSPIVVGEIRLQGVHVKTERQQNRTENFAVHDTEVYPGERQQNETEQRPIE